MTKTYSNDELRVGMVVADEVKILDGLITIKAGVMLDDNIIEILKSNNIFYLTVVENNGSSKTLSDEELQKLKSEIEEHKKILFKDCLDDEYMKELFNAVCDLRLTESMDG